MSWQVLLSFSQYRLRRAYDSANWEITSELARLMFAFLIVHLLDNHICSFHSCKLYSASGVFVEHDYECCFRTNFLMMIEACWMQISKFRHKTSMQVDVIQLAIMSATFYRSSVAVVMKSKWSAITRLISFIRMPHQRSHIDTGLNDI